jgi:hypothetical protein
LVKVPHRFDLADTAASTEVVVEEAEAVLLDHKVVAVVAEAEATAGV